MVGRWVCRTVPENRRWPADDIVRTVTESSAPTPLEFAPRRIESVLAAVGGLCLLGIALTLERAGLFLVGGAGLVLLGLAVADAVVRPRLAADADGLTVRTLGRRLGGPWPVVVVRLRTGRRLGTAAHTLEVDIGDELVVLGRRELGTDPVEVAELLHHLRPAR